MKTVVIAFDVDGTLRCNCKETCEDPNPEIVTLFNVLNSFKNTELYVWSGGGAEYAYRFARKFKLPITKYRCISKVDYSPREVDIAIDDQHEFGLATFNLIVRNK